MTDDDGDEKIDPEDPTAMRRVVYAYLGWLVGAFVDVLAETLPAVRDDPTP